MANVEQGLRRLKKHRYTIGQLLALSGSACMPFDLSKFSFDAARAGVVPPLGDCALTSRRSSAARLRNSSSGNTTVADDIHSRMETNPTMHERRPQPPPVSVLAQQNSGFARFLKKHSSPTHQRVTAGGRIVPMDSHIAPPVFALTSSEHNCSDKGFNPVEKHAIFTSPPNASLGEPRTHAPDPQPSDATMARGECQPHAGVDREFPGQWISQLVNTMCSMPSSAGESANTWPAPPPFVGGMPASYINCGPCPQATYGIEAPPWPPAHAVMYPAPTAWPYSDSIVSPAAYAYPGARGLAQPIVWAQNAMLEWSQRYHELDKQLKNLDRHRAMTNLTSDIAQQRREIVQQRSDSKNMMNLINGWLNLSEQVQPEKNGFPPSSLFNADAPAYVPIGSSMLSSKTGPSHSEDVDIGINAGDIRKPPPRSARRPIAIVPPPERCIEATSLAKQGPTSAHSPELDVDPWGVKVGLAPPELRRQQSEVLESISETQSQSSHSSGSQQSLQSVPQGGFFRSSYGRISSGCVSEKASREHIYPQADSFAELHGPKTSYGHELDSPKISRDAFVDSKIYEDSKTDSQSPHSSQSRTSHVLQPHPWPQATAIASVTSEQRMLQDQSATRQLTATPVDQFISAARDSLSASISGGVLHAKENMTISPSVHRKAATDAFLARFNSHDDETHNLRYRVHPFQRHHGSSLDAKRETMIVTHDMPQHDRFATSEITNRDGEIRRQREGARRYIIGTEKRTNHLPTIDHGLVSRSGNTSIDVFSTKGYTSTLVQNVNATAQIPHNIDGTVDDSKTGRSIFSLVAKITSPRLLSRTTGYGGT